MSKHRLSHIDGLRGIAAMAVLLSHWLESITRLMPGTPLAAGLHLGNIEYFNGGRFGVVAFFCISGFVIPFSFRGPRPALTFLGSRFFRLYPAYWLSLLLAILVLPWRGEHVSAVAAVANVTMVQKLLGQPDVLGVYWTLFVELLFYGICWLSFLFGRLHSSRYTFLLILLFLGVAVVLSALRWGHPESGLPAGIATFLAAMHFGTLVRQDVVEGDALAARLSRIALPLLLATVSLSTYLGYSGAAVQEPGWIASITGYWAGVGVFLLCVSRRWFGQRPIVFLGAISYALYLVHFVAQLGGEAIWPLLPEAVRLPLSTLIVIVLGVGLSTLVYRLVEAPMIQLGRRFNRWIERSATGSERG